MSNNRNHLKYLKHAIYLQFFFSFVIILFSLGINPEIFFAKIGQITLVNIIGCFLGFTFILLTVNVLYGLNKFLKFKE